MPKPCPKCLGSGLNIAETGYLSYHAGAAVKCAECKGKGWLPDSDSTT